MRIGIVGAGLAGCECAHLLADHYGLQVDLLEMKPKAHSPAHRAPHVFAELVCSNSLKSMSLLNPSGLLKDELDSLGSLVVSLARGCSVPAGEALAVDRELFSKRITEKILTHPKINVIETTVEGTPWLQARYDIIVIATGPLTQGNLAASLQQAVGKEAGYFYDAIAPIVDGDTVDPTVAFYANRHEDGPGDYLNLPLEKDEYLSFVQGVLDGEKVPFHTFEQPKFFQACQPIEHLAASGPRTLSFGPMKPLGLTDPRTGRRPYAAVQLRREALGSSGWNMVGFQTRLTYPAQKALFRTLPGMENAEFFRMGSLHRNTYFNAPLILAEGWDLRNAPGIYLAGQILGVEGYLESAAMGVWIGHVVAMRVQSRPIPKVPPATTALGSLLAYLTKTPPKQFSPVNIHWGLVDSTGVQGATSKQMRRELLSRRAQEDFSGWLGAVGPFPAAKHLAPRQPPECQTAL